MEAANWDQLEELYERARGLSESRRSAFLAELRARDEGLAEELRSLLALADEAEGFFADLVGALGSAATDRLSTADEAAGESELDALVGARVRQFEIGGKIASGGMGLVYRARDTRLNRTVALKFLPPHLGLDDAAKERFLVEARAVAALDHPNICTVHEVGETEEGRLYLAMACYEGETLKERLKRGPLPAAEAAKIAAQIARGLAEAHSRGIVHRDVKPGNVMLTAGGTVKLLDFGLAKLPDVTLTGPRAAQGTVAYMSPEQARGDRVDARTDVWSLGVVLYEMLAGTRPFRGADERAVLHGILERQPQPLRQLRPEAPESLVRLTERALSKHADQRPQSAVEFLAGLDNDTPPHPVARSPSPRRRVVSAVLVAALAAAAGYAVWSHDGTGEGVRLTTDGGTSESRPARITERGRVVVADFEGRGSDTVLAQVITEALRIGLARSSAVTVASRWQVGDALRRMRHDSRQPLKLELAREVAIREGIEMVIGGSVQKAGSGHVITASLIEAKTGEVERGWVETPADSTQLPAAIGRLADSIRHAAGESLGSREPGSGRDGAWIRRVTTPSLQALQKFIQGTRAAAQAEPLRAIKLFEEAIAFDSAFAAAYVNLGDALSLAYTSRGRELEAFSRAYRLRDQLAEWERLEVEGAYHRATGDLPRALEAFRNLKEVSDGRLGHTSIALCLLLAGDLAAAEAAVREGSVSSGWFGNDEVLVRILHRTGRESEAWARLRRAEGRFPDHPIFAELRVEMTAAAGDFSKADSLAALAPLGGGVGLAERHPLRHRAVFAAIRGRYDEALRHLAALRELQLVRGMREPAINTTLYAGRLLLASGDTTVALAHVDRFLQRVSVDSLHPLGRPYLQLPLADFFIEAGRPERARRFLAAYDATIRPEYAVPGRARRHLVFAKLVGAVGDSEGALAELSRALQHVRVHGQFDFDLPIQVPVADRPEVARLYVATGLPDSAVAVYQRYLANRALRRAWLDGYELVATLERLALLYEADGRTADAAGLYRRLADLWAEADPSLRPRVASALREAERLGVDSARASPSTTGAP